MAKEKETLSRVKKAPTGRYTAVHIQCTAPPKDTRINNLPIN